MPCGRVHTGALQKHANYNYNYIYNYIFIYNYKQNRTSV